MDLSKRDDCGGLLLQMRLVGNERDRWGRAHINTQTTRIRSAAMRKQCLLLAQLRHDNLLRIARAQVLPNRGPFPSLAKAVRCGHWSRASYAYYEHPFLLACDVAG